MLAGLPRPAGEMQTESSEKRGIEVREVRKVREA